jgi:magnesium transporter
MSWAVTEPVRHLVRADGRQAFVTPEEVRSVIVSGETGYWLDIERPEEADYALLQDGFKFHPLTIDDVRQQNQRPKVDEFPGYKFVVLFAPEVVRGELTFHEHHLYLSHDWLVTVHHEPAPPLVDLCKRIEATPDLTRGQVGFVQYLVVSSMVMDLFPTLEKLDETIDRLEDQVAVRATPDMLARLTDLKHEVANLRHVLGPQRDVFQRLMTHSLEHSAGDLPLYWRDVYDDILRQYEQADSLRDLITGAMDVYLSTVSNRLNGTMKQLTVVASVFLPLTFVTGFFGMNFGYLVERIATPIAFAVGLAVMFGGLGVQLWLFRRSGWV